MVKDWVVQANRTRVCSESENTTLNALCIVTNAQALYAQFVQHFGTILGGPVQFEEDRNPARFVKQAKA